MRNIAITGRMAAGKSTISNELVEEHGFYRASFAANLKDIAARVYGGGLPVEKGDLYWVSDDSTGKPEQVSGREILQRLGQSVKSLDRLFWVRWLLQDLSADDGPFVLDDMRFDYEAQALRDAGWLIVKVEVPTTVRFQRYYELYGRFPTDAEEDHPSETGVDHIVPDLWVPGDGDLTETIGRILDATAYR